MEEDVFWNTLDNMIRENHQGIQSGKIVEIKDICNHLSIFADWSEANGRPYGAFLRFLAKHKFLPKCYHVTFGGVSVINFYWRDDAEPPVKKALVQMIHREGWLCAKDAVLEFYETMTFLKELWESL